MNKSCYNCEYMEKYQNITKSGKHIIYGKENYLCTGSCEYHMLFRDKNDVCDLWRHKNPLMRLYLKWFKRG